MFVREYTDIQAKPAPKGLLSRILGRIKTEKSFLASKNRTIYFAIFFILGIGGLLFAVLSFFESAFGSGFDSLAYFLYDPKLFFKILGDTAYFALESLPAGSLAVSFLVAGIALILLKYLSKNFTETMFWSKKIKKYSNGKT